MPQNEMALRSEFIPQSALSQIERLADRLGKSGALPASIKNGAQLAMVMLAGYEAGMRPMESINAFYIVNGRLTVWGDALIRQLKRAGYKIAWTESDTTKATVVLTAPDGQVHTETFTHAEAVTAGLIAKGGPWKTYEKDMLRWKAIGRAVRFFCPEVLGGVQYLKEEADDIEAEPRQARAAAPVADIEATEVTPPAEPARIRADQLKYLGELRNELGVEEERFNAWIIEKGGATVQELTEERADAVITALEKLKEQRTAKAKEAPTASQATPDANSAVEQPQASAAAPQAIPASEPAVEKQPSPMELVNAYTADIKKSQSWLDLDVVAGSAELDTRLTPSGRGIIEGLIKARREELSPTKPPEITLSV